MKPALYACTVRHGRQVPLRHAFRYTTYMWLVDVDVLPVLPWYLRPLAGFRAADHLGDPHKAIRFNVDAYLHRNGIDLAGGRVLMLAHARVLGYVFNPISVFWCHDAADRLACVLIEVHNTYGNRHVYLLRPDRQGWAEATKRLHVSPFHPAEGKYRMRLPVPDDRLVLVVRLEHGGTRPFVATLRGRRHDADPATLVRTALRHPLSTLTVAARIRRQGIALYLRGLPRYARPDRRTADLA